VLLCLVIQM